MSDIPFNELCALEPYVNSKKGEFKILEQITLKRAGEICASCPLKVECQPDMIGTDKLIYLRTYED